VIWGGRDTCSARVVTAAAAVTTLLIGGGVALAETTFHPTTIVQDGSAAADTTRSLIYGHLESPRHKCLPNRKVQIVAHFPSGNRVLDTDRSSRNGFWEGLGNFIGADSAEAKVVRKRTGRPGHRHVCKADSTPVPLG
jgi:hypothetical protein